MASISSVEQAVAYDIEMLAGPDALNGLPPSAKPFDRSTCELGVTLWICPRNERICGPGITGTGWPA